MLVSAIIPCYNAANFIVECIESVVQQSYRNIEIICIDNNSTDSTFKILQSLRKKYQQVDIMILQEERKGAPAARNKGLFQAKGEWVQFLDADDILQPQKIQCQVEIVKRIKRINFIVGSYNKEILNGPSTAFIMHDLDPWIALPKGKLGITSSNLFNKSNLLKIGGWKESLKSSQEYDLMFRLLSTSSEVFYDPQPLTIVREQVNSISNSDIFGNNLRRLDFLTEVKHYFLQKEFQQDYIESIEQEIFEELRRVYKNDSDEAIRQYKNVFPTPPKISPSQSTSTLYSKIFNLLGFRAAQSITHLYQSFFKTKSK